MKSQFKEKDMNEQIRNEQMGEAHALDQSQPIVPEQDELDIPAELRRQKKEEGEKVTPVESLPLP